MFRRTQAGVRVLLIRDPYANWGLPKGHLENEETPAEAAVREVSEETGLSELEIVDRLPTIDWYFRDRGKLIHKFCHFFLVEAGDGEASPQTEEGITEVAWMEVTVALEQVGYANAREVIRAAEQLLAALDGDGR